MMKKEHFNVVGSGIAGSLVARMLRKYGHDVTVFDREDDYSASQASSNLVLRNWLTKFNPRAVKAGLEVLDDLGLKYERPFSFGIASAANVVRYPNEQILVEYKYGVVTELSGDGLYYWDRDGSRCFSGGRTILCCGHLAAELLPSLEEKLSVKVGHCVFYHGKLPGGKGTLKVHSPYKHAKLFQYAPNLIYFADSLAVSGKTFLDKSDHYRALLKQRGEEALEDAGVTEKLEIARILIGIRPFIEGHPFGLVYKRTNNIWAVNGGGKSGIVAYAYQAARLMGALQCM